MKYMRAMLLSLVIGFFLSYFIFKQYKNYNGITVYKEGDEYFFLEKGIYDSKVDMEKNSINLENYIYRKEDNKYYMYVGITKNKDNLTKMTNYFKNKNIDTSIKKFYISSTKFSESINNLDNILINSDDEIVINEIINQGLTKYEEIILNGNKN